MSFTTTLIEERPFISCNGEYLRVDLIESFRFLTGTGVAIRATSGLAYSYHGDKRSFLRCIGVSEQVATA